MNENIDLTKILKDCPEGFKLYTPMYGEVEFKEICVSSRYAIKTSCGHSLVSFTKEGFYYDYADAECVLFPRKTQRDWDKFTAPWYKKEKFDPETLAPFDKVLVRDSSDRRWRCAFYSHKIKKKIKTPHTDMKLLIVFISVVFHTTMTPSIL